VACPIQYFALILCIQNGGGDSPQNTKTKMKKPDQALYYKQIQMLEMLRQVMINDLFVYIRALEDGQDTKFLSILKSNKLKSERNFESAREKLYKMKIAQMRAKA
jgi:hypothetical protein